MADESSKYGHRDMNDPEWRAIVMERIRILLKEAAYNKKHGITDQPTLTTTTPTS